MTMTPEVYVNKEIMPLLLKANCPLRRVIKQDFRPVYYTKDFNDEGWQDCDAYYIPTQAQVMKWLREVHNICVYCYPSNLKEYGNWEAGACWIQENVCVIFNNNSHSVYADSYEEACETAIKYCLTNLI